MIRLCVLVFSFLVCSALMAQGVQPGTSKPAALENVPQATGVCRKDEPISRQTSGDAFAPDLSCAINPEEVLKILGQPEWSLIDPRPATEFALVHLPEAMNILPGQVLAKAYLKERKLVLTGSGKAERELYAACAMLKSKGFKQVKVLKGGLPAWLALGMPVSGNPALVGGMEQLTAAEFWTELQFDANLILMTSTQRPLLAKTLRGSELSSLTPESLSAALVQYKKANRNSSPAAVILAHDKVFPVEDLVKYRQAIHPVPLLTYAAGVSAYESAVKQQDAVWRAHEAGPKQLPCGR